MDKNKERIFILLEKIESHFSIYNDEANQNRNVSHMSELPSFMHSEINEIFEICLSTDEESSKSGFLFEKFNSEKPLYIQMMEYWYLSKHTFNKFCGGSISYSEGRFLIRFILTEQNQT